LKLLKIFCRRHFSFCGAFQQGLRAGLRALRHNPNCAGIALLRAWHALQLRSASGAGRAESR